MNTTMNFVLLALLAMASGPLAVEAAQPDTDVFRQKVAPLFAKYCIDCHGSDEPEAKLSLDAIGANLLGANLLGANLLGANLLDANLLDANLLARICSRESA